MSQVGVGGELILRNGEQLVLVVHIGTHVRAYHTIGAALPVPSVALGEFIESNQVGTAITFMIELTGTLIEDELEEGIVISKVA